MLKSIFAKFCATKNLQENICNNFQTNFLQIQFADLRLNYKQKLQTKLTRFHQYDSIATIVHSSQNKQQKIVKKKFNFNFEKQNQR